MFCSIHTFNRRDFIAGVSAALAAMVVPPVNAARSKPFSHSVVMDAARASASVPFSPPAPVPDALLALNYDGYRGIQFREKAAIWGDTSTRFSIQLFAPGNIFTYGIDISVVENGENKNVVITDDSFFGVSDEIPQLLASVGKVAGFRLHYAINNPKYETEFIAFHGASYFRAVSRGQVYGLSARGLAIDVAEPTGEEFPIFRRFWIERPASRSDSIVVHALLDSRRVTGAYRFGIYPGEPTKLDIEATLFARTRLTHIGLGTLSSMFKFGSLDSPDVPDYRPAVHDSNGLAIVTGRGEYIWRPLNNPVNLQVSSFMDNNPQGFGLIQRSHKLEDFQDLQAQYHRRPSAWIKPRGDWGPGNVALVEIPSRSEGNDNIVAYWRPQAPLEPGTPLSFAYQLTWPADSPLATGIARITRTAYGLKLGTTNPELAVDYADLPGGVGIEELSFDASLSNGTLVETQAVPSGPNSFRLFVTINLEGAPVSEMRIQPTYRGTVIGETLLHRWLER